LKIALSIKRDFEVAAMFAKKRTMLFCALGALVLATAAYAYFTSTGNGTGSGAVGSASPWTVTPSASTGGPLLPGSGTANIAYTVTNSSPGHQRLSAMTALVASNAAGNILQNGVAVPGCLASWFTATVSQPTAPTLPADLAGGASVTGGNVAVTMQNVASSQDACQARSPDITINADAAVPAAGHLYWANYGSGTIGRAGTDGSSPTLGFVSGASNPWGAAVNATHIFWANNASTIGRANVDGSGANTNFISGASSPRGVAADSAHVYWTNNSTGAIGRANVDGTGVNQSFITGISGLFGVAVDSAYIYWTGIGGGQIGRANLDGTSRNNSFITGAGTPYGVAVDSAHVYWTNAAGVGSIGRANIDGSGLNPSFIGGAGGTNGGVAVDSAHVFWIKGGSIGRANLDGTSPNQSFITTTNGPAGPAVGP
jgi:hypothetical protein